VIDTDCTYSTTYSIIFIICRSPGGTPLVNRKKKLRKGTGLAPIMAVALKNKFIVSKISISLSKIKGKMYKLPKISNLNRFLSKNSPCYL
jgi:hypothetical protein